MKASDERLGNAQVAAMWVSRSSVFQGLFSGDEMSGSGTIINVLCVREKSRGIAIVSHRPSAWGLENGITPFR